MTHLKVGEVSLHYQSQLSTVPLIFSRPACSQITIPIVQSKLLDKS